MFRAAWTQQVAAAWIFLILLVQQADAQLEPPGTKLSDLLLKRYLSNEEQAAWLFEFAHKCKDIARVFSVGKSVRGQHLWVLEISNKPGKSEPEPNFKYVANMHGDEPSGRVLLALLAEHICTQYRQQEATAVRLVRDSHLFLMLSMNPDGFAVKQRSNANGVDLNRNFPDPIELGGNATAMLKPLVNAQPEALAMMKWMTTTRFTASANLHEGAVVANYPFDGFTDHSNKLNKTRHPSPDDATFVHLAKLYASHHTNMSKSQEFKDGIVNGAEWYPVYGGMQDWQYVTTGCMDITLELSDDKWRPEGHLATLWQENREALVALPVAAVLGGVAGVVLSAATSVPLAATLVVEGINHNTTADELFGYYNRPLAPGSYNITAHHPNYQPLTSAVLVPADGSGARLDFRLAAVEGWEEGIVISTHPMLRHIVLRSHHITPLLAVIGLLVCGFGGWALLRSVHHGKGTLAGIARNGLARQRQREYELVRTVQDAPAALRV